MPLLPKYQPKATNPAPPPPYESVGPPPLDTESQRPTNARNTTGGTRFNFNQTNNQTNAFTVNFSQQNVGCRNTPREQPTRYSFCGGFITFVVVATIVAVITTRIYHVGAFSDDGEGHVIE